MSIIFCGLLKFNRKSELQLVFTWYRWPEQRGDRQEGINDGDFLDSDAKRLHVKRQVWQETRSAFTNIHCIVYWYMKWCLIMYYVIHHYHYHSLWHLLFVCFFEFHFISYSYLFSFVAVHLYMSLCTNG